MFTAYEHLPDAAGDEDCSTEHSGMLFFEKSHAAIPTNFPVSKLKQSNQVKALVSAPTKPKKQKKVKQPAHGKRHTDEVAAYFAGLHDPFSRTARGVRYLDPVSYPTTTAVSEGIFNVVTDANGRAAFAMFSDPFLSLIAVAGSAQSSSGGAWPSNPTCWYTATTGQLAGVFSTYRTVASGIQIRNLQQPVSTQGRLYAAKSSGTGWIPGPIFMNETASQQDLMNIVLGISDVDSRILTLPESMETTMQDLIQNCLPITSRPTSAACTQFKNPMTYNQWAVERLVGEAIFQPVPLTLIQVEPSNAHSYGRDVILLNFTGCPPNTTVAEIKYVYHYEGTPAMTGSAGVVTPDSMGMTNFMPRTAAAIEASAAQKAQNNSSWVEDAADTAKKIASGISKAIKFAEEVGEVVLPLFA